MKAVKDNCQAGVNITFRGDLNMFCRRNLKAKTKVKSSRIQDLMYADDCALTSESSIELQHLVNAFNTTASQFGVRTKGQ